MNQVIFASEIRLEQDVVLARRRARQVAELVGFDLQDQSRVATAVSEIARNAFQYASGGKVEFLVSADSPQMLLIRVSDRGPGINALANILNGRYVSSTGMGVGISGARRLTDHFQVESRPGEGTTVVLGKRLSKRAAALSPARLAEVMSTLHHAGGHQAGGLDLTLEIQEQNHELLRSLDELRGRQVEIERLNRELEETNRGVVALYMELDERAQDLAKAADLKSRVLSDISHEVRTPLNAILNVARLLIDRMDGDLTAEQEYQVKMIQDSARTVTDLVNDLLELARMEAGKTVARISEFSPVDLFAALRGMFRPLLTSEKVVLTFDDVSQLPHLRTDEGKVGQILRNLISNALKFTEQGEIRVSAAGEDDKITFTVTDTGLGIAPEDQERIFQEFSQIENPLQRYTIGTGLGLPLSLKLAAFLGGNLTVESQIGRGSIFIASIPRVYVERRGPDRTESLRDRSPTALLGAGSAE